QGAIIATGAIRGAGPARTMMVSSTYDHRIIQGAESGLFLRRLVGLLTGEEGFYEGVFESLGLLTGIGTRQTGNVGSTTTTFPVSRFPSPEVPAGVEDLKHVAAAMSLVKAFRHFGHMAARLDPLGSEPPRDAALDPGPLRLS